MSKLPSGCVVIDGEIVEVEYLFEGGHGRLVETYGGELVRSFEAGREFYPANSWAPASYYHEEGILLTLDDCQALNLKESDWENV